MVYLFLVNIIGPFYRFSFVFNRQQLVAGFFLPTLLFADKLRILVP
jgi:hypothetical protein